MATFGKIGARPLITRRFTARDYVQSGLIAMWDGIENAGYDVHSSDANNFKELISGEPVLVGAYGSAITTVPPWTVEDTGIRSNENNSNKSVGVAMPWLTGQLSGGWTYQIVRFIHTKNRLQGNRDIFRPNIITDSNFRLWCYCWATSKYFRVKYSGEWQVGSPEQDNKLTSVTVARNGSIKYLYFNEEMNSSNAASSFPKPSGTTHLCLSSSGYDTTLQCIRLYSRTLSSSEVAYNYSIDKIRFNLS